MKDEQRFIRNPDVSCRPEEPEGAILYNPVEDLIEVVNMTGLTIWRLLQGRTIAEIILEMKAFFEEVPDEQLDLDAREFVNHLVKRKFILRQ